MIRVYIFNNLDPYYKQIVKRMGGGCFEIFEKEITKSFLQREQQSGRAPLVSKRHPFEEYFMKNPSKISFKPIC